MKRIFLVAAVMLLLVSGSAGAAVPQVTTAQPALSVVAQSGPSQPAASAPRKYGTGGKISLQPPPGTWSAAGGVVDSRTITVFGVPLTLPVFGTDISASGTGGGNETVIASDPTRPGYFVAGANGGSGIGRYVTTNGGQTWTQGTFSGIGDPAAAYDGLGNAYMAQLSTGSCPDPVTVYKSTDGGVTWGGGIQALSDPSPTDHFIDKEWLASDQHAASPYANRIYVSATSFHTPAGCDLNNYIDNRMVTAYSTDGGATWSPSITVSDASHNQDQFSNFAIAADGTVYYSYQYQNCTFNCNGVPAYQLITKSTNGGVSWSPSITITGQPISYTGASVAGYQQYYANSTSNGFRHNDQAIIGVSPTNANEVYAIWNDGRFESTFVYQSVTGWHGDIVFSRSTDGGQTWSTPIKVNDDPTQGKDQFFPWMTVGNDGVIHASWMDRRDAPVNGFPYREYYSQSTDGGLTWSVNQPVADVGSTPSSFIGDYSGLAVNGDNSTVIPIWTDQRSGQKAYVDRGVISGGATPTPTPPVTSTPAPCGGSWSPILQLPVPNARSFGVYYPADGKFYVLGGRPDDNPDSALLNPLEYNPATNTWITKTATFNDNAVNNMAGGVLTDSVGARIYLVSGSVSGGTTATNEVRIYDPNTDSISVLASDPWPANDGSRQVVGMGSAVYNNKLYLIGGYDINIAAYDHIWQFDPNANAGQRWTEMNTVMPLGLAYVPAATLGNFIYTGGGATYDGSPLADDVTSYKYDPVNDSIAAITNLPEATSNTRAVVHDGQVWVLGGAFDGPINSVYSYDPATNAWTTQPPMTDIRRNFAADTDGTTIYVAGGYSDGNSSQITAGEKLAGAACTPTPVVTNTPIAATATSTPIAPTFTATPIVTMTDTPVVTMTSTPLPPSPTTTNCANPFVDINGNVFYNAIMYLYCRGVVNGFDPTHYNPAGTSTRAQFAKVVVLGFALPNYTPSVPDFNDVPADYFAYAFIEAGYHAGILSGFDAATCQSIGVQFPCYGPNRPITRAQLTKLVVSAGNCPAFTPTSPTFVDVLPNNVFYASIETAHHAGIINGYPDNTFRPNNNIRRDEMAQIVYKGVLNCPGYSAATPTPLATSTLTPAPNSSSN